MISGRASGLVLLGGLALGIASCAAGGAAKGARPNQPTAADALGKSCVEPGAAAEPWVVDLPADKLAGLKTALQAGVVVVAYDCKELKILKECTVTRGKYQYVGTGYLEEAFDLTDSDSVRASLSGGAVLAAKMEGELSRGTKLDVAYGIAGETTTTVQAVGKKDLAADCQKKATHFISAATIGMYVFRSSTSAEGAVTAEILGQGGSAKSTSSSLKTAHGGEKPACQSSKTGDTVPLDKCDYPLKVQLSPIVESTDNLPPGGGGGHLRRTPTCAPPTVWTGVACLSPATAKSAVCKVGEAKSCEDECTKGNGKSCSTLGFMYEKAKGVTEDEKKALEFYEKGCAKKDLDGCTGVGYLYSKGAGVEKNPAKAKQLFQEACDKGNGRACSGIGQQLRLANDASASTWFERACGLGYTRGCFYAGAAYRKANSMDKAFKSFARACDGGDLRGCLSESVLLSAGTGVKANASEAMGLMDRARKGLEASCKSGDADSCESMGDYYNGVYDKSVHDVPKAFAAYQEACNKGVDGACMDSAKLLETGAPPTFPKNPAAAKSIYELACARSFADACAKIGKKPAGGAVASSKSAPAPAAPSAPASSPGAKPRNIFKKK